MTVAAVIESRGRFLLVEEEVEGRLVYNQPAGHLEQGESLLDAVVRETREETGWLLRPTAIVGIHQWTSPSARTFLRIAFAGAAVEHDPMPARDPDILNVLWLTRAEIAARGAALRSPMVLRCIDDYLQGKLYPLELLVHLNGV